MPTIDSIISDIIFTDIFAGKSLAGLDLKVQIFLILATNSDLSGADLTGANLSGVDLSSANLKNSTP